MRAQDLALENRLPFVHLVESAGANLLKYRVEGFIHGGAIFYNLAKLSAAGLPVVTVVHGSSTAGGAYMPGLSDYVIMVRGRAKAFLAGPPLLKAATGEIATDEELGGAVMHTHVSGLGEYLAKTTLMGCGWQGKFFLVSTGNSKSSRRKTTLDIRPRSCSASYQSTTASRSTCAKRSHVLSTTRTSWISRPTMARRRCAGMPRFTGCPSGSSRITVRSIPRVEQGDALHPVLLPGRIADPLSAEHDWLHRRQSVRRGGMIKHGSKMIQAVANATVPQITVMCGASFGAGNYGMCGRAYDPRFLFSWPNATTAGDGGGASALTMAIVMEAARKRKGRPARRSKIRTLKKRIIENFERQQSAFVTSAVDAGRRHHRPA
jgi:geranyl-CoA carboxylase beta subunit